MHVRHLAREIPTIGVVAYNPSVVPGTEIARDRNWMQRLGWKYVMTLVSPILPGTRSIKRSSGDLLWLLTDADTRRMSGEYVDGREIRPGSLESRDRAKIARSVEVAKWLLNERLYNKWEKPRTTELAPPLETTARAAAMSRGAPF
jgi:hypothetical protein